MTRITFIIKFFICCSISLVLLVIKPEATYSQIQKTYENGLTIKRSLESVRDLDFQTWQVVAYKKEENDVAVVLRIVGYPGSLRLNHPQSLIIRAGIKEWELEDITLNNILLANDSREAAVEYDLKPLLLELSKNRPLRLFLPGSFNELPIPPFIVQEWRSLN